MALYFILIENDEMYLYLMHSYALLLSLLLYTEIQFDSKKLTMHTLIAARGREFEWVKRPKDDENFMIHNKIFVVIIIRIRRRNVKLARNI